MLELTNRFSTRNAFITGAASGLGKALCLRLAKEGWNIGLADLNGIALKEVLSQVKEHGGKGAIYQLDVANRGQYFDVFSTYKDEFGHIDLLINNAGVGDGGPFHDYSLENWDWMLSINQMGVIHGCYFFTPLMQERKSGHIINIASAAAIANGPYMSAYNVSKAAVWSLSETLYYELNPYNIDVSVVMPTYFKTNIMSNARGNPAFHQHAKKLMERSPVNSDEVALHILEKAGKKKFDIILPKDARKMAWTKRFLIKKFRKTMLNYSMSIYNRTQTHL